MIHAANVSPTNMHALMVNVADAAAKHEGGEDWTGVYIAIEKSVQSIGNVPGGHVPFEQIAETVAQLQRQDKDDWTGLYEVMEQAQRQLYSLIAVCGEG